MITADPWPGLTLDRRPPHQSQPVKWWLLITAMEDFSRHSGAGLAGMWGHVHRGDYETAHERFTEYVNAWNDAAAKENNA